MKTNGKKLMRHVALSLLFAVMMAFNLETAYATKPAYCMDALNKCFSQCGQTAIGFAQYCDAGCGAAYLFCGGFGL